MWVLLGLGAGLQFIEVIWAASKGYLGFFSMMVVIVTEMVITGSIYVIIYKFLIKPCNETRKLFKHFIQSGSFQELIDQDYQIFPEQNEVMQKLDSILDKKNIIELSTKHAELLALQNQINPHFLYNTFNSIRGMALYHGEKEIADLTMALSSFFRYSVQGEETVTVREALENLQRYAQIIQYRFNGKHKVTVNASRDVYLIKIPKMLIQPLVENAVLHGLETKVGEGTVRVDVRQEGQGLVVRVKDDGCGISEEKQRELKWAMECFDREETIPDGGQGIGFLNVYRRMRLFYGQEAVFTVRST